MWEQSKAAKRRYSDGAFHARYFAGTGIDVGAGPDPLSQYIAVFPLLKGVAPWDVEQGDAQYLEGVSDNEFDFLHSSHALEHMADPRVALGHWLRVVKPGGYLIITVPDEDLYEHGQWPSRSNPDHLWSFTIYKPASRLPKSINVVDLAREFGDRLELERLLLVRDFFRANVPPDTDQTATYAAECAIEIVWRKRGGDAL
jgi:predicted SAM-dependent methyltransferase